MTIDFADVSFSYGRTPVLERINWTLGPGVTGLLGPNGAGKTTLMNLIVGIAKPKRGVVSFRSPGRTKVGYLPQRFSLAGEMRLLATVEYAAWINGVAGSECTNAARDALSLVGLSDHRRMRCKQLSGGERQRLGIAAALAHKPDVLILDEPTVGLDPAQRLHLRQVIAELGRDRSVLISTHLLEDVTHLCSRVSVLADRRVVFDGAKDKLEELIANTESDGVLGSDFERAYHSLVERMRDT